MINFNIFKDFNKYYKKLEGSKEDGEVLNNSEKNKQTIIGAIFLLLLAITANFIGDTLTCDTQKILNNNPYVKFFIIFCLIYFTLSLSAQANSVAVHPLFTTISSFVILLFYILFIKCNIYFIVTSFILLFVSLILQNYIYFYNNIKDENSLEERKKKIEKLERYIQFIMIFIGILLFVGFLIYLRKQFIDHYKQFSILKFIFTYKKCKN